MSYQGHTHEEWVSWLQQPVTVAFLKDIEERRDELREKIERIHESDDHSFQKHLIRSSESSSLTYAIHRPKEIIEELRSDDAEKEKQEE